MLAARLLRRLPSIKQFSRSLGQAGQQTHRYQPVQHQRWASYRRFGERGQKSTYSNFPPFARAQYVWRNYQTPILITGAAGGTFYVINQEEVPITHRRRFNWVSSNLEKQLFEGQAYNEIIEEFGRRILPDDHPYTQMVTRVVRRLLASSQQSDEDWEVHVIDDPKNVNAFVSPGGKVFVFTGILPICQDETGLATVLGHEIAHTLARHTAERVSRSVLLLPIIFVTAYVFDVSGQLSSTIVNLLLSLPNSRTQESEADHIGLVMMAASCYDPDAAVNFWDRMDKAEKQRGGTPPQFLSTHPSSYNRIGAIRGWLTEAKQKYNESNCSITASRFQDFNNTVSSTQMIRPGSTIAASQPSSRSDDDDFF